jgi:hypothetical protein
MFSAQNLATALFPCANIIHSYCHPGGVTYPCVYYNFYTHPCGYTHLCIVAFTGCGFPSPLQFQQVPHGCPVNIPSIPGGGGPEDPVEALQALRRQLEVALAGVEAQERVLREQRAAAGGEAAPSRARPGARGQRSE